MPHIEGRTVGEQQKNSTFKLDLKARQLADNRKISVQTMLRLSLWTTSFLGVLMKINKKDAIRIITEAAKKYEECLNNNTFLIVYEKLGIQEYVEISFRDMFFLHLTGITTKLSAQRFYKACIANKLSDSDITIDNKGKVEQKLAVIPYLHELLFNNCMIGDFINSGIKIRADYFVGDTKFVLSLGVKKNRKTDIPVSLYKEDVRKLIAPKNKVLLIMKKKYNEEKYSEKTFISKKFDIKQLNICNDLVSISGLMDKEVL